MDGGESTRQLEERNHYQVGQEVLGKLLGRIFINRIREGIDSKLKKEQA